MSQSTITILFLLFTTVTALATSFWFYTMWTDNRDAQRESAWYERHLYDEMVSAQEHVADLEAALEFEYQLAFHTQRDFEEMRDQITALQAALYNADEAIAWLRGDTEVQYTTIDPVGPPF